MKKILTSSSQDDILNVNNDEIDLRYILNFLFRNKKIISSLTIVAFVLGCFYALSKKRVWEGRFEIVLKTEKSSKDAININPSISQFVNLNSDNSNNLETEIGILESPSVLMPIFEFVNSEKISSEIDNKQFKFFKWKDKNLSFNLKKGTSILNIAYQDTDKKLILPVLNKILKTYQDYSGRNKKRTQELAKTYLTKQIKEFRDKSALSIKKAQEFSIDQVLYPLKFEINRNRLNLPTTEIESLRVISANKIKKKELQIQKISEFENDLNNIQYLSSSIPILIKEGLPTKLSKLDEEIVEKRAIYNENDLAIQTLLRKKERLLEYLRNYAIGHLRAQILEEQAIMEASMRPKEVLLKYKELIREARRDEATLINLEDQISLLELEEAKLEDPWELITNPTLLKDPVAPSRTSIALYGGIIGFFIGSCIAYFREKFLDIIYESKIIKNEINTEFIEQINDKDLENNSENISLICTFIRSKLKQGGNISIFKVGEIDNYKLNLFTDNLSNSLNKDFKEKQFLISTETKLSNLIEANLNILVLCSSKLKYSELKNFKKRVKFHEADFSGAVVFN